MFRKSMTASLLLLCAVHAVSAAEINGSGMSTQQVVQAAFQGYKVVNHDIGGHVFHIWPISVVRQGNDVTLSGNIQHKRTGPNRKIYFQMVIRNGVVAGEPTVKVGANHIRDILGKLKPSSVPDLGSIVPVYRGWDTSLAILIQNIAIAGNR